MRCPSRVRSCFSFTGAARRARQAKARTTNLFHRLCVWDRNVFSRTRILFIPLKAVRYTQHRRRAGKEKAQLSRGFKERIVRFVFPKISRGYLIRLGAIIITAFVLFRFILLPMHIRGGSMEPTYRDGGFTFCWLQRYLFSEPERFDVVTVRLAGPRIMYLKRVVAFPGETVAFKDGNLYVNDRKMDEPHVVYECDWNKPPVTVKPGHLYVVGDNRSVPMENHQFGQIMKQRITGSPLW
ncbi:MAG: signal peptidase I [Spartobacteria bacterium]|nr:signal peptidase I [Spartobacteria bacterium]